MFERTQDLLPDRIKVIPGPCCELRVFSTDYGSPIDKPDDELWSNLATKRKTEAKIYCWQGTKSEKTCSEPFSPNFLQPCFGVCTEIFQHQFSPIPVLNIRRVDNDGEQIANRIGNDVSLPSFDLFAGVVAAVSTSRAEAKTVLFEYMEVYYNRQRLHSSLGYLTPVEYEQAYYDQVPFVS